MIFECEACVCNGRRYVISANGAGNYTRYGSFNAPLYINFYLSA